MSENKLRDLLGELQAELERSENIPVDERARLEGFITDVRRRLDPSAGKVDRDESAMDQLQETATRFEVTHPQLTEALARVINSLSDIGI